MPGRMVDWWCERGSVKGFDKPIGILRLVPLKLALS